MADVELRRRTRGAMSLDRVVIELARCCARRTEPVTAREMVADLDRIAGIPVFAELMQRWVLGPHLPDLEALFARLGLVPGDDGVRIAGAGEDGWIREAIMRRPPAPAHDARR
jgi:predicted metalloprotease with PDZ domain